MNLSNIPLLTSREIQDIHRYSTPPPNEPDKHEVIYIIQTFPQIESRKMAFPMD